MTSIMMIPEEEAAGKAKAIMHEDGRFDSLTRDIIALTVSVLNGCDYCSSVYTAALRNLGQAILEVMSLVDLFSGLNKFNSGLQVEPDGKPWYGCGGDNMSQPPGFNVFQDWQHQVSHSLGFASLFDEYQRLVCSCLLRMTQNEAGDPSPGPVLSEVHVVNPVRSKACPALLAGGRRVYSLTVSRRVYSLTISRRVYSLTISRRVYSLTVSRRVYSLTVSRRGAVKGTQGAFIWVPAAYRPGPPVPQDLSPRCPPQPRSLPLQHPGLLAEFVCRGCSVPA